MIERLRLPDGYDIKVKKHDDVYELIMVEYYDKTQDDKLQERFMNTKKLLLVMFPGQWFHLVMIICKLYIKHQRKL